MKVQQPAKLGFLGSCAQDDIPVVSNELEAVVEVKFNSLYTGDISILHYNTDARKYQPSRRL